MEKSRHPSGDRKQDDGTFRITRDGLRDGSVLAKARSLNIPGFTVLPDREIEASLEAALAKRPGRGDVWVFGYGSLMWNPAFEYAETRRAVLVGWHRSFCLTSFVRGTPKKPGLMLGLDEGGQCEGIAFRIPEEQLQEELRILWVREMLTGVYQAHWPSVQADGTDLPALAFVVNRGDDRYWKPQDEGAVADRLAFAAGPLGSCWDYLRNTRASLERMGISDPGLDRLHKLVEDRHAAQGEPARPLKTR
ncbi:gamma-glutamylcyclotransferase [Roseibium sp. RKSG952]|uniref:gamma-glutamylcyclotransferase n=1 Tax=Roseibium sp. RKSG952 TaxID=2529384 RepID=UPI0012BCCA18|nr:gamma-glutamylcyclotransferase [Roseibium sp. RKSG952]MTH99586.1 calcium transporter ChaC [Roseibium sp. RKSG952]